VTGLKLLLGGEQLAPMQFEEERYPFDDPGWLFEIKYDGHRILASTGKGARLTTRRGADATAWFPEVVDSLRTLQRGCVIDGEITVLDDMGRSDLGQLQARAKARRRREGLPFVTFCAFDLLVHRGQDGRGWPLKARKEALGRVLADKPAAIRYVQHVIGEGKWLFDQVLALELEGMVAKRVDSVYKSGERTRDWLKIKRPGTP
jgi:bifunctional non-homologous end joining protein LigD